MKNLIAAINRVYDERESRSFIPLRALALGLTIGAIVVPRRRLLRGRRSCPAPSRTARWARSPAGPSSILRWPALALGWMGGLAVLYRLGPGPPGPKWRWVTPGAIVATVVWLLGSLAFSAYTAGFASYNETYGALGAVVITMLWLQLTALAILLGAEVNAELEHQTVEDSTTGPERPLGERGAVMADTVGAPAEVVKAGRDQR